MRHPFRRKNLSLRLAPYYLLAGAGFALSKPTASGFALGGALVVAGAALRAWGAGHLVKNDRLSVSGPYARLRHPLYAGTLLLALGFGTMAGPWGVVLAVGCFVPLFFLYYLPYKERIESARLERRYGAVYARYRTAVPVLLPSLARWRPPPELGAASRQRWSRERFRENGELGTLLGVALGVGLMLLRPALPL